VLSFEVDGDGDYEGEIGVFASPEIEKRAYCISPGEINVSSAFGFLPSFRALFASILCRHVVMDVTFE
jgi:hypothetical protein